MCCRMERNRNTLETTTIALLRLPLLRRSRLIQTRGYLAWTLLEMPFSQASFVAQKMSSFHRCRLILLPITPIRTCHFQPQFSFLQRATPATAQVWIHCREMGYLTIQTAAFLPPEPSRARIKNIKSPKHLLIPTA